MSFNLFGVIFKAGSIIALMPDTGGRSDVRPVKAADKSFKENKSGIEENSPIYMIPMRAVVEQVI